MKLCNYISKATRFLPPSGWFPNYSFLHALSTKAIKRLRWKHTNRNFQHQVWTISLGVALACPGESQTFHNVLPSQTFFASQATDDYVVFVFWLKTLQSSGGQGLGATHPSVHTKLLLVIWKCQRTTLSSEWPCTTILSPVTPGLLPGHVDTAHHCLWASITISSNDSLTEAFSVHWCHSLFCLHSESKHRITCLPPFVSLRFRSEENQVWPLFWWNL